MSNNGIVNIHGKEYMTVARRVEISHEEKALESVVTEVLSHEPVVIKATVTIRGQVFTGISSVDKENGRQIERQNPYEVAETSAVGRALGFAGYGLLESIASADEVVRASTSQPNQLSLSGNTKVSRVCDLCGRPAVEKQGKTKTGKEYHGIFCTSEDKAHTVWL